MKTSTVRQNIYELASRAAEDEGLELVSIDMLGSGRQVLLRVFVDREGGVTIKNCEKMSRGLEALLDVEDPIKGPYMLEVSSPGLDRPLVNQKDYERNIGKLARIVTTEKIDNQTFFVGRIIDTGEGWIRLSIEEQASPEHPLKKGLPGHGKTRGKTEAKDIFVPLEKISKARLEIEINRS